MFSYINSITINSKDRTFGDRTNFNIRLGTPIKCKQIELESANIPNSFYQYVNISIDIGGNIIVLNGCYSATSLSIFLQSSLPGTYSVVFNLDLLRFVIVNTAPFTLTFPSLEDARIMGFDALVTNSDINDTIISNRPPDLQKYKNVLIDVREIGSFQLESLQNSLLSFTFKVPVFANKTDSLPYRQLAYFHQINPNDTVDFKFNDLNIRLIGDDGYIIDESQINDWMFSIRLYN